MELTLADLLKRFGQMLPGTAAGELRKFADRVEGADWDEDARLQIAALAGFARAIMQPNSERLEELLEVLGEGQE